MTAPKHALSRFNRRALALTLAGSFALISTNVMALPQGGVVAAGAASIASKGAAMTVTQSSNSATYNWQSFNIGQSESVHFQQPGANSVALNYVLGNSNSIIDGALTSNGQLFLSNPNGILFGATAQVNVAGLTLDAGKSGLSNAGKINVNGGSLVANAGIINNTGIVEASHATQVGGKIVLTAGTGIINTGSLLANGSSGGSVLLTAGTSVLQMGSVQANGATGAGGLLDYRAADAIMLTQAARDVANGATQGGTIHLQGNNNLFTSSTLSATGQQGGTVDLLGGQVTLAAAQVDASGSAQGGLIRVGGDFHGANPAILNAQNTMVNGAATLKADGGLGKVVVWSDKQTNYYGNISANLAGNIEVSSKGTLNYGGTATAGKGGTLLLDPANIVIGAGGGGFAPFALQDPHPMKGNLFGSFGMVTALGTGSGASFVPNGKVVVVVPKDSLIATGAGAVYLFDTATGALISTLTGSAYNDQVGIGGVTALSNGNYVVSSWRWNNGAAGAAGAVTWGSATTGVSGAVSAANSLVGSTSGDKIGSNGLRFTTITALNNGNYVVGSSNWSNGAATMAGAVTWGNGATGTVGTISAANSLVGTTAGDQIGADGFGLGNVIALSNGNYVVGSPNWNNGLAAQAGAVTWGNGTTGISGAVSAANSLVGTTFGDMVGSNGITPLSNGNYVVSSMYWNNGAATQAGAVTWGNGTTGITGAVSAANSLVGTNFGDQVGFNGIFALSNGNYLVQSPTWNNTAGAVTWVNGTTGVNGAISAANSLVGTSIGDLVGLRGTTLLTNGNYVINSYYWSNGAATLAGAVTWGNGTTGVSGAISAANSLVGTVAGDSVGASGITALSNGNYVVNSANWHPGPNPRIPAAVGAVTWGDGTSGVSGAVSAANSLLGATGTSMLGSGGILDLQNGSYLINSPRYGVGNIGQVLVASTAGNPTSVSNIAFADTPGQTVNVPASNLAFTLAGGTAVTLQASNDITVNNDVLVSGNNGGSLTLQAGRSIVLNANINTANGALTLIGNDTAANGVVNADRAAGTAVISMASGSSINTGSGALTIRLLNGAGNTNTASGNVTLGTLTAGNLTASSTGSISQGAGSALTVNGASTLNAAGNVNLANAGNNFVGAVNSTAGGTTALTSRQALTATLNSTGAATLKAGGTMLLSGTTGGLTATANQVGLGNLLVRGAVLVSSGNINLANPNPNFVGILSAPLAGQALLTDIGTLADQSNRTHPADDPHHPHADAAGELAATIAGATNRINVDHLGIGADWNLERPYLINQNVAGTELLGNLLNINRIKP